MDKTPIYAKENRSNILRILHPLLVLTVFVPWHLDKYVSARWCQLMHSLEVSLEILIYLPHLHLFLIFFNVYVNFHIADMEFLCTCTLQGIVMTWSLWLKIYFRRLAAKKFEILSNYILHNYWTRSAPGFTYVTMDGALKNSKRFFLLYGGITMPAFIIFLMPLLAGKKHLPLPCWYPFDYQVMYSTDKEHASTRMAELESPLQPYIYECAYLLQFVAFVEVVSSFFVGTSSFVQFCIIVAGQYDILFCSLKNILATSYIYVGAKRHQILLLKKEQQISDSELNAYGFSQEEHTESTDTLCRFDTGTTKPANLAQALRIAVADCVLHHSFILEVLVKMENFYNILMLMKSGEFIALMCMLGFVYAKSTSDRSAVSKILLVMEYISLALFELFITCHYAEMVTQASVRCGEAVMRSPWYLHMLDMKQDLLFLLEHANRPFHLTAGKVYFLGYERFRTFLTTSFSFVTLLKNFDNRQRNL